MSFSQQSRKYLLPQHSSHESLEVHYPSQNALSPYEAPLPPPPRSSVDTAGLQERVAYGTMVNKLKKERNISPRFFELIQKIRRNCMEALKLNRKSKEFVKLQADITIDSNMLRSRFDETHGPGGLCETLVHASNAMLELRLKIDYGDYLAVNCAILKEHRFQGLLWKKGENLDWIAVGEILQNEISSLKEWRKTQNTSIPRPLTPWVDDLERAADVLETTKEQLLFEIDFYSQRNQLCHSNIKNMLEDCDWSSLAQRIVTDKKALAQLYRDHPEDAKHMSSAIERLQFRWFTMIKDSHPFSYFATEEALMKTLAMNKRHEAAKKKNVATEGNGEGSSSG